MRSSSKNIFAAILLSCALVFPSFALRAQDSQQPATRPRRATADAWPTPAPDSLTNVEVENETARITSEPVVRIGLAVNARSVNVSTTGHLLNATEPDTAPVPFDVARIRVEPRSLPPIPAPDTKTNDDDALGIENASASDVARQPQSPTRRPIGMTKSSAKSGVLLTSRASSPTRGTVLYAPGSPKPLLDARARRLRIRRRGAAPRPLQREGVSWPHRSLRQHARHADGRQRCRARRLRARRRPERAFAGRLA